MCVLVDAVEHQVGGSNPALAKELKMLTFDAPNPTGGSTTGIIIIIPITSSWDLVSLCMEIDRSFILYA